MTMILYCRCKRVWCKRYSRSRVVVRHIRPFKLLKTLYGSCCFSRLARKSAPNNNNSERRSEAVYRWYRTNHTVMHLFVCSYCKRSISYCSIHEVQPVNSQLLYQLLLGVVLLLLLLKLIVDLYISTS